MTKTVYMVFGLKEVFEVETCGGTIELPIKDHAAGCVGAALVFESREAAQKYAREEGGLQVGKLEVEQ